MPEWIVCASCQLKHSRRPDETCPRCHQPYDGAGAVVPAVAAAAPAGAEPLPTLGDLAQTARSSRMREARGIFFFVGALTVLVNAFFFANAESNAQAAIDAEMTRLRQQSPGFVFDMAKVEEAKAQIVGLNRVINGGALFLGIVFLVLGVIVPKAPVVATITGLVLYIGSAAVFGFLEPSTLTTGAIVKVLIVAALFRSLQAALAERKEAQDRLASA